MTKNYDLIGIGNAISDANYTVTDDFLLSYDVIKGTMLLTEQEIVTQMREKITTEPHNVQPGGSCGNSITLFAKLGGTGGFIGKVANDDAGKMYRDSLETYGIEFLCPLVDAGVSGSCLVLVSPDAQRTMITTLGVSGDLSADDIDDAVLEAASAIYLEGYLYDKDAAKSAFDKAAKIARAHKAEISLSLSDIFCVERHREDFYNFVTQCCDILFANEQEFYHLYQIEKREEALEIAKRLGKIICMTLSDEGAYIIKGEECHFIPTYQLGTRVDTTGAGDSFAGGFLYGLHHNLNLQQSGHLASLLAGDVITQYGPRTHNDVRALINQHLDFAVP